jgi:hypothetical protein
MQLRDSKSRQPRSAWGPAQLISFHPIPDQPQRYFSIIPIPGTTSRAHLREDIGAADVVLSADLMARLDALINQSTVQGARYNVTMQPEIDTEEC